MRKYIDWEFPLPRTHTGIMLGNGTTGMLVWGEGSELKITIGRADFWDHRGGMPWTEKQNYKDIKKCLENNDGEGIKNIFACSTENVPGQPDRPSVLPVGRLDLILDDGAELKRGRIELKTGIAEVVYSKNGIDSSIKIQISMKEQIFHIELPDEKISVKEVPSWEFKGEYFSGISFEPPVMLNNKSLKGWVQKLPADPALCVGYKIEEKSIWALTERGGNFDELIKTAEEKLASDSKKFAEENSKWWNRYWEDIPEINVPNESIDFVYCYGLYKFAGFTNPAGVPATLQGPWIEEYELPPWSSDYHFNINVQMCYWPAYKANRLTHLKPLFDMVWSWRDKLRSNAKAFLGIDDGYMLPHAVDDRCVCMGSFWTGAIDHACSAWIAQMMYEYFKYTADIDFLRETAYPFMKGVMRVYESMLEKEGEKYSLPVSVSPEYKGASMDAWGRNASFQLAAIHRLCENLIQASKKLDEKTLAGWKDILENLPKLTLVGPKGGERIALWEGADLDFSHRHHSHLAAITPFDTVDIDSDEWAPIISRSINHWIKKGMGQWTGWCIPWASMIHSRLGNGDAAETLIELWRKIFTNEGHGSLHDCNAAGLSVMGAPSFKNAIPNRGDVMQMDGGMGAVVAVQDMLMHSRRGVIHIFPGTPPSWKNAFFKDMPCEGGFLVSAVKEKGKIVSASISSRIGDTLKIANPWGDAEAKIKYSDGSESSTNAKVIEIFLQKNSSCEIS